MTDRKRNILRKEWTRLRTDIERVRKELNTTNNDFRELSINDWKTVYSNIENQFLHERPSKTKRSWLWDDLKVETFGISCKNDPYEKLGLLIDKDELVYFLVNETVNEMTKYWFYEGKVDTIISVIGESLGLDEYYLISKKYDWLLCTNHHDVLIGTGAMISIIKDCKEKITAYNNV